MSYPTSSTTSLTIGTGAADLIVGTSLSYTAGIPVAITHNSTNYMTGDVVSYNSVTGELLVTVTNAVGKGTYTSWTVTADIASNYPITFGYPGMTATGVTAITSGPEDAFNPDLQPSPFPSSAGYAALGPYAIAITSTTQGSRSFAVDTSFEPYRREAFRHRSIQPQREAIQMTNITGQGTVNTEGLWRREQVEWSMGAGQQYLDRKQDSQETRFLSSKGVDVFSYPLQATLLPDTVRRDSIGSPNANLKMVRCNDYIVFANGNQVEYVLGSRQWGSTTICTYDTTTYATHAPGGLTGPTVINDITSNDTYVFIATDTGIWQCQIGTSSTFQIFASNDVTSAYSGGYDMVRWANDQLLASRGARLFAFQPRSATTWPFFGTVPSISDVSQALTTITASGTTATFTTGTTAHNLVVGQPIIINGTWTQASVTGITFTGSSSPYVATVTTSGNHGLAVGETFTLMNNDGTAGVTTTVETVPSTTTFTFTTTSNSLKAAKVVSGEMVGGTNTSTGTFGYNGNWTVASVPSSTTFTVTVPSTFCPTAFGGTVTNSTFPDALYTHENQQWLWSGVAAGETQIYLAGYVKSASGKLYGGGIYRSDMNGTSTTTSSNVVTITNSSVVQPFQLNTPIQALPMSPDEYPTCIASYLNYIFIGTNRGIRMAQTLSIYDPTATATGDLRAGPLIPNILQPVTLPVTAIVGDGRYVWFAWNNYDDQSTGLGKLDLSTFIAGDPLAPAYASDIMVTGQGIINSLIWDPFDNIPLMAIGGMGIYGPFATNEGGNQTVYKYVPSGYIDSGYFTYGLPDPKIPVSFDYGVIAPRSSGTYAQAFVNIDPLDSDAAGYQVLPAYPQNGNTAQSEFPVPFYHAEQFGVRIVLYSDAIGQGNTPILHRWTLKAWPATVQGTQISVVLSLFQVNVVDGQEISNDPYENFIWLENLRQAQEIVQYQEGPISVRGVIEQLDWIPHKRRDNYENGFEGDCVVFIKTVMPYEYHSVATIA